MREHASEIEPTESERVYLLAAYASVDPRTIKRWQRDRASVKPSVRQRIDRAARQIETTPNEKKSA